MFCSSRLVNYSFVNTCGRLWGYIQLWLKKYILVWKILRNLADEYEWSPSPVHSGIDKNGVSGWPNIDNHNDLSWVTWSHFIGRGGYEAVGTYEGGLYVEEGIWRPEEYSIMRHQVTYFNAPSREAIVKRILEIKEIPYSFEAFLKNDVIPNATNARVQQLDDFSFQCRPK